MLIPRLALIFKNQLGDWTPEAISYLSKLITNQHVRCRIADKSYQNNISADKIIEQTIQVYMRIGEQSEADVGEKVG